ncbi:uncharacterized protein LOC133039302 [Cannabis sativa]|uniref:uncharacterized protein LOC133039302 n=1 Tax=Cannabis sativa TaxID=3483 RepID=UPI0029CA7FC2|nr:uncharacterized protein LOC133039302 [Cannabis sativa]
MAGRPKDFSMWNNEMLVYKAWVCVPNIGELKKEILDEAHTTPYSLHSEPPRRTPYFWWYGMKRDVVEYVSKCLTYQQIKAEHQRWTSYQSTIAMASYEMLYGGRCRSPIHWDKTGERKYLGPELVQKSNEVIEKIKARMLALQSRQKG